MNMRTISIAGILLSLFGCDDGNGPGRRPGFKYCISASRQHEMAKWIVDCVAAGNNVSNEDPEDGIYAARSVALDLFSHQTFGMFIDNGGGQKEFIPYDLLSPSMQREVDAWRMIPARLQEQK